MDDVGLCIPRAPQLAMNRSHGGSLGTTTGITERENQVGNSRLT